MTNREEFSNRGIAWHFDPRALMVDNRARCDRRPGAIGLAYLTDRGPGADDGSGHLSNGLGHGNTTPARGTGALPVST